MKAKRVFQFTAITAIFLSTSAALSIDSKDVQITEVRKKLQMKSTDPVIRDYYLNGGTNLGIKEGALIKVFRNVPLADPNRQEAQEHVILPVGVIKIIYADRLNSIGRVLTLSKSETHPVLESENFMVGDRLELRTLDFEKKSDEAGHDKSDSSKEAKSKDDEDGKPEKTTKKVYLPNREAAASGHESLATIPQSKSPEVIIK